MKSTNEFHSVGKNFPHALITWGMAAGISFAMVVGILRESVTFGTPAALTAESEEKNILAQDENSHTNILLLGVGDKSHAAASLTDSIVLVSIDGKSKSAAMLSVPRDLYVGDIPGIPAGKINSVYAYARNRVRREEGMSQTGASLIGMNFLANELGQRLGVDIHGVLKMDFIGFTKIIDALGGVDVVVHEDIVDRVYPLHEGIVGTYELQKGLRHFDGASALRYARSRHGSTDFSRSARQQDILSSIVEKTRSLNVIENIHFLRSLIGIVHDHFESTFNMQEILALASEVVAVDKNSISRMSMNYGIGSDSSKAIAGGFVMPAPSELFPGSILVPISSGANGADWSRLRTFARFFLTHHSLYVAHPTVRILRNGASSTQAKRLENELLRYGIAVQTDEGDSKDQSSVMLVNADVRRDFKALAELLRMELRADETVGSDIVVSLGHSYIFIPFLEE